MGWCIQDAVELYLKKVSNGILIDLTDQGKIWVTPLYKFIVLLKKKKKKKKESYMKTVTEKNVQVVLNF